MFDNSRLTSFRELCVGTLNQCFRPQCWKRLWKIQIVSLNSVLKFWFKEAARSTVSQENYIYYRKSKEFIWVVDPSNLSWSPLQVEKCSKMVPRNMLYWLLQVIATSSWCWLGQRTQFFLTFYFRLYPTKTQKATLGFCSSCALLLFTVTSAWMFQNIS